MIMQTQKQSAVTAQGAPTLADPVMLRKRIGSTIYTVSVHFSRTSHETMEDKILRLIQREVNRSA